MEKVSLYSFILVLVIICVIFVKRCNHIITTTNEPEVIVCGIDSSISNYPPIPIDSSDIEDWDSIWCAGHI